MNMVNLLTSAALGVVAGVIPVYLGLIPLLFIRKIDMKWRSLLVSFAVGILVFLLVEVMHEAIELGEEVGEGVGQGLFVLGLSLGLLILVALETMRKRDKDAHPQLFLAYMVAMGIGLHNLGEGLAIGSSYAAGNTALSILLVVGFALHNGTEGFGIAAPLHSEKIKLRDPLLMGFIAGFPTVVGAVVGAWRYSSDLGTLFFAVAAGAILYVIVELIPIAYTKEHKHTIFIGILLGIFIMYLTELLVEA